MRLARLRSIGERLVSFDTETYKLGFGEKTAKIVVGSAGWFTGGKIEGVLLDKDSTRQVFAQLLEDPNVVVGGANIAYDLAVMTRDYAQFGIDVRPLVFEMLEQGRVFDLQIAEALNAIAEGYLGRDPRTGGPLKNPETGKPGSYSLSMCVDLTLGRQDAKVNDDWKLRYGELDGLPIPEWPAEARDYPVDDARNTHEVILAQTGILPRVASQHDWENVRLEDGRVALVCKDCKTSRISAMCMTRRPHKNLHEVANQTYSAYCLYLGDSHGLCVDQARVDVVEAYYTHKRRQGIRRFIDAGVIREDETENQTAIKRLVAIAYGSVDPCPFCDGKGEVPHAEQPTLRCPDCRGRCQPWKAGGKIKPPEVAHCATCNNTARVAHHNVRMTKCTAPNGKSCCGTGLLLDPEVPRSDTGDIAISADALNESGDEFLMALGEFKDDQKVLKTYVPYLRTGRLCTLCRQPATKKFPHLDTCPSLIGIPHGWLIVRVTLKSNVLLETGRVSYRGLIQTFPRWPGFTVCEPGSPFHGMYIFSLRECFVAEGGEWIDVEVPDDHVVQPNEYIVRTSTMETNAA